MAEIEHDSPKRRVADRALDFVQDGMLLGLGSGTTATIFVDLLAERVRRGLRVTCVPTSERTRIQAEALSIDLTTLDDAPELDLTIDGADEFDTSLRLIKGGGGALLREKIVAAASKAMVVIADAAKEVEQLGRFPLPVEVNPFGLAATKRLVERAAETADARGPIALRRLPSGGPFVTDGGHYILDCRFGRIQDPETLARRLNDVPGVVEHGLFIGYAQAIVTDHGGGTRIIDRQVFSPIA